MFPFSSPNSPELSENDPKISLSFQEIIQRYPKAFRKLSKDIPKLSENYPKISLSFQEITQRYP
jgi:hypothetical protein